MSGDGTARDWVLVNGSSNVRPRMQEVNAGMQDDCGVGKICKICLIHIVESPRDGFVDSVRQLVIGFKLGDLGRFEDRYSL